MRHRFNLLVQLTLGGCGPGVQSPAAFDQQAALLSQVVGFGGCDDSEIPVDSSQSSFFPGVVFIRGKCEAEHGETLMPTIARDKRGEWFQLGSRAGTAYFLRRNPPDQVSDELVRDYALFVARLTGEVPTGATAVSTDSLVKLGLISQPSSVKTPSPQGGRTIELGFAMQDTIVVAAVLVYQHSGQVRVLYTRP